MEVVVLQQKDASDWIYRGEGAANVVLAYSGSSPLFVGKLLRIRKVARNGSEEDPLSVLTKYEHLVWKENKYLVSASTREIAEQLYAQCVMSPLLGPEHVDAGINILASKEFLETVERNVLHQRPSWRVAVAKVNPSCDSVLLVSDHSIFPLGTRKGSFCISVEIKPKCGFLPCSEFIKEGNAIKRSTTRFKMHQALKLHQGKISHLSAYNPLDMFSGSKDRIHKAIKDLFNTPQNNFRVFLNGSLIFGGSGDGADDITSTDAFENILKYVILAHDGMRTKAFLDLVTEAVFGSGLLNRLLAVQKLDKIDIEGAIHAYYEIISQPCMICRNLGENELLNTFASLHSIPMDVSLKIVRDYLIAATAKDLSMIICFSPGNTEDQSFPYGTVFLNSINQSFNYKASFIDLDRKSLKKMEYYYELDQQIVSCYNQTLTKENQLENGSSIEKMVLGNCEHI